MCHLTGSITRLQAAHWSHSESESDGSDDKLNLNLVYCSSFLRLVFLQQWGRPASGPRNYSIVRH